MLRHLISAFKGTAQARAAHGKALSSYDGIFSGIQELIAQCPPSSAEDDEQPIFLLSAGWRSGSTLVQRLLMSDPDVLIWGEPYDECGIIQALADSMKAFRPGWPPADYYYDGTKPVQLSGEWIANLFPSLEELRKAQRAFFDTLETSTQPVLASHSGCKALHDHPRNLSDAQLGALARHGGVVGIVFHPGFLDAGARAEEARVRTLPAYTALQGAPMAKFLAQQRLMRSHAAPLPAARLVEHLEHAVELAGIDHVGLGSDYDGIERTPQGLEDARGYAVLAELLAQRGFSDADLLKILGGNMERVFRAATGPGTRAHELRAEAGSPSLRG